jgi:hypothetical protein
VSLAKGAAVTACTCAARAALGKEIARAYNGNSLAASRRGPITLGSEPHLIRCRL